MSTWGVGGVVYIPWLHDLLISSSQIRLCLSLTLLDDLLRIALGLRAM